MKYLIVIAVAISAGLADVVWTYDFQVLPDGWTADPQWEFGVPNAHVFVSATGGSFDSEIAEMTSDTFIMPYGTTSASVGITDIWFFDGYATSGESFASIEVTVFETTVNYTVEFDSQSWGTMMEGSGRSAYITIPAGEGTEFHIGFTAYAEAENAYAEVDWDVTELQVIARGAETLEQSTWAKVKYSF